MTFSNSMMHRMPPTTSPESKRHDLIISPFQIHPTMYLYQQVHENRHKQIPSQDMSTNDIQREIRQQNQGQPLNHSKPIRNLRVDLGMRVVRKMKTPQIRHAVERNVDAEEQRVVDEERHQQLQHYAPARRYLGRQRAYELQRRAPGEIVHRGREERTPDPAFAGGERCVATAPPDVAHGDAGVLLDEDQIHTCERDDGFAHLDQACRGPLQVRKETF